MLHVGAASLAAQAIVSPDTALPAGTIRGSVVVAETGIPLEDAVVVLEPTPQAPCLGELLATTRLQLPSLTLVRFISKLTIATELLVRVGVRFVDG